MAKLTIQIFNNGIWHDAAELIFTDLARGRQGPAVLGYDGDYAIEWMYRDDEFSCSINLPIELAHTYSSKHWFTFIDDIMPAGASRRYWVNQLGLQSMSASEQDYILLKNGTIAPVGNMRIKEALPELPPNSQLKNIRFTLQDVIERDSSFLEYAQQMGAAAGGATGAGGEAPKLLLCCSRSDEIWIDTFQNDIDNQDTHYLVKFPRGKRASIDCDILRAEYYFYQELASVGINTIDTEKMRLLEGERYPSFEEGGNFNWKAIITELSDLADPNHVFYEFQQTAQKLMGLKSRLKMRGVPDSILNMPGMAFDYLDEKLQRWAQL